jgi:hypothetical protein
MSHAVITIIKTLMMIRLLLKEIIWSSRATTELIMLLIIKAAVYATAVLRYKLLCWSQLLLIGMRMLMMIVIIGDSRRKQR